VSGFLELVSASRIYRTIPTILAILVPAAFADKIAPELGVLILSCILIYAVASIHNAKKDNDYSLPEYYREVMIGLAAIALAIASSSRTVFFTAIAWIALGLFYNTIARRMLFGDNTVLAITHFGLPVFSSSIITGIDARTTAILTAFTFAAFWFESCFSILKV